MRRCSICLSTGAEGLGVYPRLSSALSCQLWAPCLVQYHLLSDGIIASDIETPLPPSPRTAWENPHPLPVLSAPPPCPGPRRPSARTFIKVGKKVSSPALQASPNQHMASLCTHLKTLTHRPHRWPGGAHGIVEGRGGLMCLHSCGLPPLGLPHTHQPGPRASALSSPYCLGSLACY